MVTTPPLSSSPPSESIAPSPKVTINPMTDHNLTEILPIVDARGQVVADLLSTPPEELSYTLARYPICKTPKSQSKVQQLPDDLKRIFSINT